MSDEELIARLRAVCTCNIDSTPCMAEDDCRDALAAADRIEALVKDKEQLGREVNMARYGQPDFAWSVHKEAMADLEAKLAKAVKALESVIGEYDLFREAEYERGLAPLDDEIHEARATLAEIKGESHD